MTEQTPPAEPGLPTPDPALRALDRFVGTWRMTGHLAGSDEETITGEATYSWLPGGFFLQQQIQLSFGTLQVESTEMVGYDPETRAFPSLVFSNMSPTPLHYTWHVDGHRVTITVTEGVLDATFTGEFSADGNRFSGGWRPNEGADPTVNVAYDVSGTRLAAAS